MKTSTKLNELNKLNNAYRCYAREYRRLQGLLILLIITTLSCVAVLLYNVAEFRKSHNELIRSWEESKRELSIKKKSFEDNYGHTFEEEDMWRDGHR